MKDTSHVFDSVVHICLVNLLSEQVHCHLYTLCNEWFKKKWYITATQHNHITGGAHGIAEW